MVTNGINGNKFIYEINSGDNLTRIAKKYNTTIEDILKLNPQIKEPDLIITGNKLIITDNKPFMQKEDYSPNNMNMSEINVGGEQIKQLGGEAIKSNFFANNLSDLSEITINDENPATKIVILIQAGKTMTRKDNNTPYSILNKVIGDHIENNTTITRGDDGKFKTQSEKLENTDLYKAFISEDINGDNFQGENNTLLARGQSGNKVQVPAIEIDANGNKYFTLQGEKDTLYFDAKGKRVEFENGIIKNSSTTQQTNTTPILEGNDVISAPNIENEKFLLRMDNNDKVLNIGTVYINGKAVDTNSSLKSNFYANNIDIFTNATLNDDTKASRLDIQLNLGSQISSRDTSAQDILKKMLANNINKTSQVIQNENGKYQTVNTPLQETDLYKSFVSEDVNGNNFTNNKIVRNENGFNIVQFPALETDENGNKYYTLHTSEGKILYFNDSGEEIKVE